MSAPNPDADIEEDKLPSDDMANIYPSVFYCPITRKLLEDPVVSAYDGISYERSSFEGKAYDNRSLKCIVEDATQSTLQKFQNKARQFIFAESRPLPSGFYCPITLSVMHEPVIDPQGYSYEKNAIEGWIQANGDSPVTRTSLSVSDLVPNRAIAELLLFEANKVDDLLHPAIRKWKSEPIPSVIEMTTQGEEEQAATVSPPAVPVNFPRTREEYAAQLAEATRQQRRRSAHRFILLMMFCVLVVASFFIRYLSAILLAAVLVGICFVTHDATH